MGTDVDLADAAATGSIASQGGAARTEIASKLDIQRELEHKRSAALATSDTPRRARRLLVATTVVAILAGLWSLDLKPQEFVDVPRATAWVQDTAGALVSNIDAQRQRIAAGIQGLVSTSPSQETISPDAAPKNIAEVIETVARGLYVKIDQVRASSDRSIGELGAGVDRLSRSMERNQRDLMAKLDKLQERLDRIENHSAAAPMRQAQPVEKPTAEKPAPPPSQPAGAASAAAAPKPKTAPVKRIENWAVREVVDGMAILAGPRGLVGVFSGDVVPGLGRVESISRRDGRWVVATRRGVITGQ
jgi:hypothetical protein